MERYNRTRFGIVWLGMVLAMSLLIHSTVAATPEASVVPRYGGKYNVPLSSEPETLDPAFITDIYAVTVANNLYDGLVQFDKDLNIVPAISDMWRISRDRKTYTFQLRQGVHFHNGREVTADDFVFSIRRILDPTTQSPVSSLYQYILGAKSFRDGSTREVQGLDALDRYTLIIRLEKPFAPFLSILAMANAKVIPKEGVTSNFSKHPVGTGPFKFNSWEPGKEIILTANENYYLNRPYLDSLFFHIYPNIEC